MKPYIIQVAIPNEWWYKATSPLPDFVDSFTEALEIERRIKKGIDKKKDFLRYSNLCENIESLIRKQLIFQSNIVFASEKLKNGLTVLTLDPEYSNWLQQIQLNVEKTIHYERLFSAFFPPELLLDYLKVFKDIINSESKTVPGIVFKRQRFIMEIIQNQAGLVELVDWKTSNGQHYSTEENEYEPIIKPLPAIKKETNRILFFPLDEIKPEQELSEIEHLRLDLNKSIERNQVLNLSNYRHTAITKVLYENIFFQENKRISQQIKVVYGDGSEALPITLNCLSNASEKMEKAKREIPLRFSLLSIRHPELDAEVDAAWFSNRLASKPRDTIAETDLWSYHTSLSQLENLMKLGYFRLDMYHTGLEPAVVGFYRAVIHLLKKFDSSFCVISRIYRGPKNYPPECWWV